MLEKYVGIKSISITEEIDIHHNYAALEEHFDKKVMVDGYKDIDMVIANEQDLIEVTNRLTQIAVIKG